jgi:hypothetical protein
MKNNSQKLQKYFPTLNSRVVAYPRGLTFYSEPASYCLGLVVSPKKICIPLLFVVFKKLA